MLSQKLSKKSRNSKSAALASKVEISDQEFRFGGERLFLSGANQVRDPRTVKAYSGKAFYSGPGDMKDV